jgi:hypothetical protein
MSSLTVNAYKTRSGRYEYRISIDRKNVRCGVVQTKQDVVSALDESWDDVLERFVREG